MGKKSYTIKIIIIILVVILLCLVVLGAFHLINNKNDKDSTQIANPASVYCVNHGGRVEIREDNESNQYGVCIFENGSECEEWSFFGNKCPESTSP